MEEIMTLATEILSPSQLIYPFPNQQTMARKRTSVIQCVELVKNFSVAGHRTIEVLKKINLTIYGGEYVILYGPSGSGKSTLLHLIAGLEWPSAGHILIRGKDIGHFSRQELAQLHRTKIGLVFQQFNLIPTLTVLENVCLPQVLLRVPIKIRRERAMEVLKTLSLDKLVDHFPAELSGGEQQRVAIARALINNPWILLVDEPTGNLDSLSAEEVMRLIRDLNAKSHRTILLVTHNPDYVYFAHRVLYLRDGVITREVVNRPLEVVRSVLQDNSILKIKDQKLK